MSIASGNIHDEFHPVPDRDETKLKVWIFGTHAMFYFANYGLFPRPRYAAGLYHGPLLLGNAKLVP